MTYTVFLRPNITKSCFCCSGSQRDKRLESCDHWEDLKPGQLDLGTALEEFNLEGPGVTSTPNKSWPFVNASQNRYDTHNNVSMYFCYFNKPRRSLADVPCMVFWVRNVHFSPCLSVSVVYYGDVEKHVVKGEKRRPTLHILTTVLCRMFISSSGDKQFHLDCKLMTSLLAFVIKFHYVTGSSTFIAIKVKRFALYL